MEKHYPEFIKSVRSDIFRIYGSSKTSLIVKAIILNRTFRPVFSMRLCQLLSTHHYLARLLPIAKILHRVFRQWAGIDLAWQAEIGPGFVINHGWGLVIGANVKIGSNVTVFHGVTLGRRRVYSRDGSGSFVDYLPTIQDDVWVGPNALVLGPIVVGRGSKIAPGALVREDVEPFSLVMGNPGFVVKTGIRPDVNNRADLTPFGQEERD